MFQIRDATVPDDIQIVRILFEEYAKGLGVDLCFQNFAEELADLPGKYSRPKGRLLVACDIPSHSEGRKEQSFAACVALRPASDNSCEMKRLYVRPAFRRHGLAKLMIHRVMSEAKIAGYSRIVLDTLPQMGAAIQLYRSLGFTEIDPYYPNPVAGAIFLEKQL